MQHRDAIQATDDAAAFTLDDDTWNTFVNHAEGLAQVPYKSQTLEAFDALKAIAEEELLHDVNASAIESFAQACPPMCAQTSTDTAAKLRRP